MAKPWLAAGKKRYSVTLTEANVSRFQALCDEIGLPNSTLSSACDDVVKNLTEQWEVVAEKKRNGGTYGISDLFTLMGQQLGNLFETEKEKKSVPGQKRDKVSNSKHDG